VTCGRQGQARPGSVEVHGALDGEGRTSWRGDAALGCSAGKEGEKVRNWCREGFVKGDRE
jgi:hypothetical protein